MKAGLSLLVLLLIAAPRAAEAQTSSSAKNREGFAIGPMLTPALEGGGPWFMPGLRASAPLGSRFAMDVEVGRIYGASGELAQTKTFAGSQLRFVRPNDGSGPSRYWLAGLKYLGRKKADETGAFNRSDPDMALLLGYGWRETYPKGLRVLAEVGAGGGEGFMLFVNVGFQWGSRGAN